jgi:DNA-binding transcriptional ArsR family regulator
MVASIRLRILRFLVDREEASDQSGPGTAGEIAKALQEPLGAVVKQLSRLEAAGLVELAMTADQPNENIAIRLKPPAHVYLNANREIE